MNIDRVKVDQYGPLKDIDWSPPQVSVIYDDNAQGKTSLVELFIRYIFVSRKDSTTFENFLRFQQDEPEVTFELEQGGSLYQFGTGRNDHSLADLLGWNSEEELYRLLCIRASHNSLVSRPSKRSNLINALASLVSGVGTEQCRKIDRDLIRHFQLTSSNNWANRKDTEPSKLYDYLNKEALPFLEDWEELRTGLQQLARLKAKRNSLSEDLEQAEHKRAALQSGLECLRARHLDTQLSQVRSIRNELREYDRIKEEYNDQWKTALSKIDDAKRSLQGSSEAGEEGLNAKVTRTSEELKEKRDHLQQIPQKIDSIASRIDQLETEVDQIQQEVEQALKSVQQSILKHLHEPLQEIKRRQHLMKEYEFWFQHRFVLFSFGLLIIFLGTATGLSFSPWLFLLAGPGMGFSGLVVHRATRFKHIRQEREKTIDETVEGFNDEFEDYLDEKVKDLSQAKLIAGELPSDARQQIKDKHSMEEKEETLHQLQDQKTKLHQKRKDLKKTVNDLQQRLSKLEDKQQRQKEQLDRSNRNLQELREKSGQPTYDDFQHKLEQKQDLRTQLNKLETKLQTELDQDIGLTDGLIDRVEMKIDSFSDSCDEFDISRLDSDDNNKEALNRRLKSKEQTITNIEQNKEQVELEISQLKSDLRSSYNIDPERPEQLFEQKKHYIKVLQGAIRDRIAGSVARETLEQVSANYIQNLDQFLQPNGSSPHTVSDLFSEVMGDDYSISFDYDQEKFIVEEGENTYTEDDLSSGARKQLFYATRLALVSEISSEPVFLLLDDPYLNHFRPRKRRAITQLHRLIEQGWQITCFSVDRGTRDYFEEELDAEVFAVSDL